MIRIYLLGLGILFVAIITNGLAGLLGLKSWYDLLHGLMGEGKNYIKSLNIFDFAWLLLVYPLILGASAFWILKLGNKWN